MACDLPGIAIHIFHLSGQPTTYFPTGSGDTTLAYIENVAYVVLALIGTLVSVGDLSDTDELAQ